MDGKLKIPNNRAERSIKPFVIGRKNFLFANTPKGTRASAVLYGLVGTTKENGLNSYKYLVLLLQSLSNYPKEHWAELLPGGSGMRDSCRCPVSKLNCYAWEDEN